MISAIAGRAIPSSKRQLAFTAISAVLVTVVATVVFGYDPVAQISILVALIAGDFFIVSVMALGGIGAAFVSRTIGFTRRTVVFAAGSGAVAIGTIFGGIGGVITGIGTGTAAVAGAASGLVPTSGILGVVASGIIAIAVGNPVLIGLVGAATVFFAVDPLSSRGSFGSSLSFAVKIATVSLLAYLTVIHAGPTIADLVAMTSVTVSTRGGARGA